MAGQIGSVWAQEWARTDRSFADLSRVLDARIADAIPSGQSVRIVDIGCGAGATSIACATARPDATVTGIDISADLLAIARQRAAMLGNIDFREGSADALVAALAPVDLFMSRHGVMFFDDPGAAFTALRRAAAPGARLIFSCFRSPAENRWATGVVSAIGANPVPGDGYVPGPFAFADPGFVTNMLARAGWQSAPPEPVDYVYHAGAGDDPVGDALSFFTRIGPAARALRDLDPADRAAALDRLRALLSARVRGNSVDFDAAAWLWSARAD